MKTLVTVLMTPCLVPMETQEVGPPQESIATTLRAPTHLSPAEVCVLKFKFSVFLSISRSVCF